MTVKGRNFPDRRQGEKLTDRRNFSDRAFSRASVSADKPCWQPFELFVGKRRIALVGHSHARSVVGKICVFNAGVLVRTRVFARPQAH